MFGAEASIAGRIILATSLAAALLVRLGAAEFALARGKQRLPDSDLYLKYADSLRRDGTYVADGHRARRAPGYPVFLSLVAATFGPSERAILWVQAVVATLTVGLVYLIARRLAGPGIPPGSEWLALFFAALDPYAIALSAMILSETLYGFLLTGFVALCVRCQRGTAWRLPFALGMVGGAGVLVRPSGLPLVAAGLVTIARREKWSRAPAVLLAGALGAGVALAPWWVRNARQFGAFVPTTLNVGESLYDGLGPQATGASDTRFAADPATASLSEVEQDRHWWRAAWSAAADEPGRIGRLALVKLARFWSPWPNESSFRHPLVVAGTTAAMVPTWILALVGAWRNRGRLTVLAACLGPALYFTLLHLVFASSVRYRVPAMGLVDVLAGAGLASWLLAGRAGERPRLEGTGIA